MGKAIRIQPFLNFTLCLLAFSIPTKFIFSSICLGLLCLLWLFQADYKKVWDNFLKRRALWPWLVFYILLAISYLYSEDKQQATFDLKSKLAYIIIPIVVGLGIDFLDRKFLERFFVWLILGVTTTAVISLGHAAYIWQAEGTTSSFFYHDLVSLFDPNAVYAAWYSIFSISLLLFMPWKFHFTGKNNAIRVVLIIFLLIFFLLLSARMFTILFLLLIIPYIIKKSFKQRKRGILVTTVIAITLFVGGLAISITDNPIKSRFENLLHRDNEKAWLTDYTDVPLDFDNASLRIFLWRLGIESLNEKGAWLTGVGNGDVHHVLRERMVFYKIPNISDPNPAMRPGFHNANLHNMFLQSLLMIGISGLIIMSIIAFTPIFYLHKVLLYQPFLLFNITSIFFMMQEAVLQTQAGMFFYILINSIFWNLYYNKYQIKKQHL